VVLCLFFAVCCLLVGVGWLLLCSFFDSRVFLPILRLSHRFELVIFTTKQYHRWNNNKNRQRTKLYYKKMERQILGVIKGENQKVFAEENTKTMAVLSDKNDGVSQAKKHHPTLSHPVQFTKQKNKAAAKNGELSSMAPQDEWSLAWEASKKKFESQSRITGGASCNKRRSSNGREGLIRKKRRTVPPPTPPVLAASGVSLFQADEVIDSQVQGDRDVEEACFDSQQVYIDFSNLSDLDEE
jgi:hypothetical protein